jgi:choloylglycine hydrolase
MRIHRLSARCGGLLMAALGPGSAQACMSFLLRHAATLIQRGARLQDVSPNGIPGSGLNWQTQYAAVGTNALGQPVLVDGLNAKGLAGGLLNAPNSAIYQKVGAGQSSRSIASYQLLTYALSTCATVEEVKTKLLKILVNQSALSSYGGVARIHRTVNDRSGNSLALKYLNGQLVMRDNPTGVFTHDPPFEQHHATLGNDANLVPNEAAPLKIGGVSFGAVSSGGFEITEWSVVADQKNLVSAITDP